MDLLLLVCEKPASWKGRNALLPDLNLHNANDFMSVQKANWLIGLFPTN